MWAESETEQTEMMENQGPIFTSSQPQPVTFLNSVVTVIMLSNSCSTLNLAHSP